MTLIVILALSGALWTKMGGWGNLLDGRRKRPVVCKPLSNLLQMVEWLKIWHGWLTGPTEFENIFFMILHNGCLDHNSQHKFENTLVKLTPSRKGLVRWKLVLIYFSGLCENDILSLFWPEFFTEITKNTF